MNQPLQCSDTNTQVYHADPGGCLPSLAEISKHIAKETEFQLLNLNDIGKHYVPTLLNWLKNLDENCVKISELGFCDKFLRMWRYYFCYCTVCLKKPTLAIFIFCGKNLMWLNRQTKGSLISLGEGYRNYQKTTPIFFPWKF